jgi:hypothetical protein
VSAEDDMVIDVDGCTVTVSVSGFVIMEWPGFTCHGWWGRRGVERSILGHMDKGGWLPRINRAVREARRRRKAHPDDRSHTGGEHG